MNKIIALSCALVFALSLTACGKNMTDNMGSDIKNGASRVESSLESGMSDIASGAEDMTNGNNMNASGAKISKDEAKDKALKHAGVAEKDVTGLTVDLDRDDGDLRYEIDFHHGGYEYDYEINAETGELVFHDKEKD